MQRFAVCSNRCEFLFVSWKSFFWMSAYSLTQHDFIDISSLRKFFFHFWLETVVLQSPCSRVQFVVFRLDDFPLFNNSVVNVWIKMIPFVNVVLLCLFEIKFVGWCQQWVLLWSCSWLLFDWGVEEWSVAIASSWTNINDIFCWHSESSWLICSEIA